jgi:hypothetical protein
VLAGSGASHQRIWSLAGASSAHSTWVNDRRAHLDELRAAHRLVGGAGLGRRWRSAALNEALVLRLAAEFRCSTTIVVTSGPVSRPSNLCGGRTGRSRPRPRPSSTPVRRLSLAS